MVLVHASRRWSNEIYCGLRLQDCAEIEIICVIMAAYLDDLSIGSDSTKDHMRDLRAA